MQSITEEGSRDIIDGWYVEAKTQTLDTINAFIAKLATEYSHDYGTICHAITAAGYAAMCAVDHSPQGGITGFQAGAIQWEIIRAWGVFGQKGDPLRIVNYENMLYPQYEDKFASTISPSTAEWLKEHATKKLQDPANATAHPDVIEHWKSVAGGVVPFGYTVEAK